MATVWKPLLLDGSHGARYLPLDPIDFEARYWVPHSGWPITFDEMVPYYDRARTMCGIESSVDFHGPLPETALAQLSSPSGELVTRLDQIGPATTFTSRPLAELASARRVHVVTNASAAELTSAEGTDDAMAVTSVRTPRWRPVHHQKSSCGPGGRSGRERSPSPQLDDPIRRRSRKPVRQRGPILHGAPAGLHRARVARSSGGIGPVRAAPSCRATRRRKAQARRIGAPSRRTAQRQRVHTSPSTLYDRAGAGVEVSPQSALSDQAQAGLEAHTKECGNRRPSGAFPGLALRAALPQPSCRDRSRCAERTRHGAAIVRTDLSTRTGAKSCESSDPFRAAGLPGLSDGPPLLAMVRDRPSQHPACTADHGFSASSQRPG